MQRKVLIDWFYTPKGRLLKKQEAVYLKQSITVSCKQVIVQIGALGWEDEYLDCSAYEQFYVVDDEQAAWYETKQIRSLSHALPFKPETVDLVILPHILEFSAYKHELLRDVDRVLKPEGKLIVLGFNPWNIYINLQYVKYRKKLAPWLPSLVSRTKISDWLNLLNFETEIASGFNFDKSAVFISDSKKRKQELFVAAYAVKAIKRCYRLIPLKAEKKYRQDLAMAKLVDSVDIQKSHNKKYDENS
ncbi:MAG: methyltransferase domain-containing protein [Methyloprofundus sp.]|nr:methyltransferase domain-containing protein [Methyloprofundus sp.]